MVEIERRNPVLADAAVVTHVEADRAFDFGVDQPVAALDAQRAGVQVREGPGHFYVVITDPHHVDEGPEQAVGDMLFSLYNVSIRERGFLVFLFY